MMRDSRPGGSLPGAGGVAGFVQSVGSFSWLEWKTLRYYPSNLLLTLTEGLVNTGIWLFIGLFVQSVANARVADYGGSYVSYVVIGVAFFEVAQTALLSPFKSVSEAFWDKRLEAYNLAPHGIWAHILGRLSWQMAYALVIETVVLGAIVLTVGIDFSPSASPWLALLCLAMFGVACLGLGLAGASTFFLLEVKDGSEPVSWTATLLARVASGVYYPLSIIPVWLQPFGLLVPHTFALRAIRLILLDGRSVTDTQIGSDLMVLAIYALAALAGGSFLLHLGLRHAERTSGLSVVG
jgi:ABC-2 type transport system permease protein